MMHDQYESPLSSRYASPEMLSLFSPRHRIVLFRKLWLSLATAEQKLGLNISQQQLEEMRKSIDDIPFEKIQEYEKRFRHDVMAHIHAFGDQCPSAKPIIHLGATSTFVTDNADLVQLKEALALLNDKISLMVRRLSSFAEKQANTPTVGWTHYQMAQPTTVGKRACLWLQDFLTDALEWERLLQTLPFLGAKGATGTQASFLSLFDGDDEKVKKLELFIAHDFGFENVLPICGQTYPRKIDLLILNALSAFAAGAHKMATDLRLLAHDQELQEPHLDTQIGSSAMPHKHNPMYAERICALSRFVIALSQNPAYTLATQWLERTLDDSANRRLCLSESFLCIDAILNILISIVEDLHVNTPTIESHLEEALPQLMIENILMEAVKKGGNRQELHEKLRKMNQAKKISAQSIAKDPAFHLSEKEVERLSELKYLIGRAPAQVKEFLKDCVQPYLKRHSAVSVVLPPLEL